ncbi:MAG: neutral zinc metallopeptidase [Planctomycetota bacterium]|nr:MAG: neutral zinc metallopeptidase [Planctomycetota bacterium]
MFFFDPLYFIVILPAAVLAMWATARTKSAFTKYARVGSRIGLSGAQVARRLLDQYGLRDVGIEKIGGQLSDHYDPRQRVLRLSHEVHDGTSLASLGVATHELGHALQHAESYSPLMMRQAFAPVAGIASNAWGILFLGGILLASAPLGQVLITLAVVALSAYVLFALITLPVEYDASNRALALLESSRTLQPDEMVGASKVLRAAGLTYVASAAQALSMLVYVLMRANGSRD